MVIQPFVTHNPEIAVYSTSDLDRAQHEMFQRVVKSNDPESKRTPGEDQCKFCLAKATCLQYQKWSGSILPATTFDFSVPMAQWTPEQRTKAAKALGPAQQLIDYIKDMLKEGFRVWLRF